MDKPPLPSPSADASGAPEVKPSPLSYATPTGPTGPDHSARRPGIVMGILIGTPVVLEVYMHIGAQWAYRREGRTGSLDFNATGTDLYERLLITGPMWALAVVYVAVACWMTVIAIRKESSVALPIYISISAACLWMMFCVCNGFTLWDDISP